MHGSKFRLVSLRYCVFLSLSVTEMAGTFFMRSFWFFVLYFSVCLFWVQFFCAPVRPLVTWDWKLKLKRRNSLQICTRHTQTCLFAEFIQCMQCITRFTSLCFVRSPVGVPVIWPNVTMHSIESVLNEKCNLSVALVCLVAYHLYMCMSLLFLSHFASLLLVSVFFSTFIWNRTLRTSSYQWLINEFNIENFHAHVIMKMKVCRFFIVILSFVLW